jgi:signal transduction histidine kinase
MTADAELAVAAWELEPTGLAVLAGPDLRVRATNAAFRAAIPTPPGAEGRPAEQVWTSDAGPRLRAVAQRVLATGRPAMHERWAHAIAEGVERVLAFHVMPLPIASGPAVLVGVWDTSDVEEARRAADRARERAEILAAVAGELSAGAELEAVSRTGLTRATALLGAADGALWLLEADGRRARCAVELRPLGRPGEAIDLGPLPLTRRAARTLAPVLFTRGEADGPERELLERWEAGALLAVPLAERGRCIGLLHLAYREGGRWPRPEDVDFAQGLASQCSLAVARARLFEAERAARGRAEAAEAEARRVGELQERLAAVVGHDLRTPLAAIRLSADALAAKPLDPAGRRAAARIASSSQRMEAIVRDLLDFAHARGGGGIPVALGPARLDEIARQACQEAEAASGRSIRLEARGDCALVADASRLGQVVANLVANALDHAPGADVAVRVDGLERHVRLDVHNDGPPIAPEALAHLFEPFRRTPRRSEAHGAHLGLGLFIVAEVARVHGGTVAVSSSAEAGTTFSVTLPRDPARR